jgi:tRNA nucleotidyltransferase (CCA-adding enzyme)
VLLKHFLESDGLYGSSLKVQGFSGYLCEILIWKYGSFQKLVEEVSSWGQNTVLDPENHHEELPEKLERKFSDDSLVVIDPVDPERNVASVLTTQNYSKFIYRCWEFNRKPGVNFFEKKSLEVDEFAIKKELGKRGNFLVLEIDAIEEPEDIVYPQMRKTLRRVKKKLRDHEFRVYDSGFYIGSSIRVFFELDGSLPGVRYQKGPKVFHGSKHLEEFTSKYENVFIGDDRVYAKIDREFESPRQLLKEFLGGSKKDLMEKGIPGNVAEKIERFRMVGPLENREKEWLKFLMEELRIEP